MIGKMLKDVARNIAPDWAVSRYRASRHPARADEMMRLAEGCRSRGDCFDLVKAHDLFFPQQMKDEILGLMEIVAGLDAKSVCEIGSYNGGTLFLFARVCRPDVKILSVDLKYGPGFRQAFLRFALPGQEIRCLEGDSHSAAARDRAAAYFGGEKIDFLFIDGDHSYDGVKADFELFSPMVRPGGVVAFHDINPDFNARGKPNGGAISGEVPRFWSEIRGRYAETRELVQADNWTDQDGAGIGVIFWPGS